MESTVLGPEGAFGRVIDIYEKHGTTHFHDPRMRFIATIYESESDIDWLRRTYMPHVPFDEFASGSVLVGKKERLYFILAIEALLEDLRKDFPETVLG